MIGVLFDLDGVLINSEELYTEFWSDIDRQYPTGIEDFAYTIKGNNLARILNTYFPDKNTQDDIVAQLSVFEKNMPFCLYDGVIDFLNELNEACIPIALVTSSGKSKMGRLYEALPDFKSHFQKVITGDIVSKGKPDPECFLTGAKAIGVDIHDCWIFEDSPSGIKAALRSGAKVIALKTTLREADIDHSVNHIIPSLTGFKLNDLLRASQSLNK